MPVPTEDELREFIDDPLKSKLETNRSVRNGKRRRSRILTVVYLIISLPITCATTVALRIVGDDGFWSTYWVAFAMVAGWIALYTAIWRNYVSAEIPFDYSPDIAAPLIHYIDPRIHFRPHEQFRLDDLEALLPADDDVESYRCDEFFVGSPGGVEVKLGSVELTGSHDGASFELRGLALTAQLFDEPEPTTALMRRPADDAAAIPDVVVESATPVDAADTGLDDALDVFATDPEQLARQLPKPVVDAIHNLNDHLGNQDFDGPPEGFVLIVSGTTLTLFRPADDYFGRPDQLPTTDTAHLHQIGGELSAFIHLTEAFAYGSQSR